MKLINWIALCLSLSGWAGTSALSPAESKALEERLESFYRWPAVPEAMNQPTPKFSIGEQEFVSPNQGLKQKQPTASSNALLLLAQAKKTPSYDREKCEKFLKP